MIFISSKKLYLFFRYWHFCPDLLGYVRKRLDNKAKVNFKIYCVTNWNTGNCNKHIARYLKNKRQSDNEIWSVNRI